MIIESNKNKQTTAIIRSRLTSCVTPTSKMLKGRTEAKIKVDSMIETKIADKAFVKINLPVITKNYWGLTMPSTKKLKI